MDEDRPKELEQVLYEAYCEAAGWKSAVTGAALPPWDGCSDAVRRYWEASAKAARAWYTVEIKKIVAGVLNS